MKRFVVDTNVLIDFVLAREEFYEPASLLMQLGYIGEFELWVGSSQISDLVYVVTEGGKASLAGHARGLMKKLRKIVHIYATDESDYDAVANSAWNDLEDAFVFQTALNVKANAIITRNKADFMLSPIKTLTCVELFAYLEETEGLAYAEMDF